MSDEFREVTFSPNRDTLAMFATSLLLGHVKLHSSFSLAPGGDWITLLSGDPEHGLALFREKMGKRIITDQPIARPTVGPMKS